MAQSRLNYLFITGMGRSGTTFLGKLLDQDLNVSSGHEQIGNREYWLLSWYLGSSYSIPLLQRERARIDRDAAGKQIYVDVNSYLQHSTDELKQVFETENVLHLIRDPKEVIRSIYTRRNDNDIHLLPKNQNEVKDWIAGDRFYQVCVNWKMAMDQLLEKKVPLLRFEQLISDFDYTKQHLLDPFGISLSAQQWEKARETKTNRTPGQAYRFVYAKLKGKQFQRHELGKFDTWPTEYKQVYTRVCGEVATKLGYT